MTGNWPYLPKGEPKSICEDTSVEKLQETLHEFLDKTSSGGDYKLAIESLRHYFLMGSGTLLVLCQSPKEQLLKFYEIFDRFYGVWKKGKDFLSFEGRGRVYLIDANYVPQFHVNDLIVEKSLSYDIKAIEFINDYLAGFNNATYMGKKLIELSREYGYPIERIKETIKYI